jgi:hypothetical protein
MDKDKVVELGEGLKRKYFMRESKGNERNCLKRDKIRDK